jgi:hypothetical protein
LFLYLSLRSLCISAPVRMYFRSRQYRIAEAIRNALPAQDSQSPPM